MICPATPTGSRRRVAEVVAADRDRLAVDLVGPAGVVAEAVDRPAAGRRCGPRPAACRCRASPARPGRRCCARSGRRACTCSRPRSRASIRPQGPVSNALRAALTAQVDVGGVALGDLGDDLLGRRVDRLEGLAAGAVDATGRRSASWSGSMPFGFRRGSVAVAMAVRPFASVGHDGRGGPIGLILGPAGFGHNRIGGSDSCRVGPGPPPVGGGGPGPARRISCTARGVRRHRTHKPARGPRNSPDPDGACADVVSGLGVSPPTRSALMLPIQSLSSRSGCHRW